MESVKAAILTGLTRNRSYGEHITKQLGAPSSDFSSQIQYLQAQGKISVDLANFLHTVRKNGNEATHEFIQLMQANKIFDFAGKLQVLDQHEQVLKRIDAAIQAMNEVTNKYQCFQTVTICFDVPADMKATLNSAPDFVPSGETPEAAPAFPVPIQQPQVTTKPGDWTCKCGNLVFASKSACFKCGTPKPNSTTAPMVQSALPAANGGDWNCSNCGYLVFRSKSVCGKCNTPKQQTIVPVQPPQGKPGDWICKACGNLVFASKSQCGKCHAPKQ